MAGQLYRSQQETWSFKTGNNASVATLTKTDFSGGVDGVTAATATLTITGAGVAGNIIEVEVDKGSGNIRIGTYIVQEGDSIGDVRDELLANILSNAITTDITPTSSSTNAITLTAPLSVGAGANTWTVTVFIQNNVIEPQHNASIPNASIFPFPFPLRDTLGVQVKATQSVDSPNIILLSTGDWYITDLKELDWLYIQGEKRQVIHIFPSLQAVQIRYPFTADVTNEDVFISYPDQHRHIKITAIGTADTATVDNVPLKSGAFVQYDNNGGILPMVYDASGENEQLKFEIGF